MVLLIVVLGLAWKMPLRRTVATTTREQTNELSQLAAGLAHEIRNPLHAIQLNLHSMRRAHENQLEMPPEELSQLLAQSTQEIYRIEQLINYVLQYAAPDALQLEVLDLSAELRDVAEMIRRETNERQIEVNVVLPAKPVRVEMDRARLRQIMVNLLSNAEQAIGDKGHIRIELSTGRRVVEIVVADSGPGISSEQRRRVFEPFFTTRSDATGLGLAMVKRFVEQLNGRIVCRAAEEGGAAFHMTFATPGLDRRTI